jgi:hypothetical protein
MCKLLAELYSLGNKSDQEFPPENEAIKEIRFYRVLTMVHSTQRYWVFGFFHRPVFLGVATRCIPQLLL